jgi:hypothetical protein
MKSRIASSKYTKRVEASRKKASDSKLFYRDISSQEFSAPATEILHEGKWYEGPLEVMPLEVKNLVRHMGGRSDIFHEIDGVPNPLCAPTPEGKMLRQSIAEKAELKFGTSMYPPRCGPFLNRDVARRPLLSTRTFLPLLFRLNALVSTLDIRLKTKPLVFPIFAWTTSVEPLRLFKRTYASFSACHILRISLSMRGILRS